MEKQSSRGGSGAGSGAGASCKDGGNVADGEVAAANIEHGSHQVADHVVQKAVAADAIDEQIAGVGLCAAPKPRKRWCGRRI